jgi:predicted esterase
MTTLERPGRLFSAPRWLLAAVLVCTTVAARASDDEAADFKQLERQFNQAYKNAEYEKALEIAGKMHKLEPEHLDTLYNTACLNCLLGHKDQAYVWLDKAIEAGFRDAEHLARDDDFKTIRAEDKFRAIVKRLRSGKKGPPAKTDKPGKKPKADKPAKAEKPKEPAKPKKPKQPVKPDKPDKPKNPELLKLPPQENASKITELTGLLIVASGSGEREEALKIALEALDHACALREQVGDRAAQALRLTNYNVACMYSLMNKKDAAFKYLDEAIDSGGFAGDLVDQIEDDQDFDNIRKDTRYAKALEKAKKGGGRRRAGSPPEEGKPADFAWKVTLPKKYDKSKEVPLIVALHDYNSSMRTATKRWKKAANKVGAILLTPQGTYSLSEDHFHWGRNLDTIEENVMDAINEIMDSHKIDQDKVVLTGLSQGAWATWSLALRNPDTFCGIIPVAGRFEPESESYFEDEDLADLRIFIMVGEEEQEQVLGANKRAAKQFKEIGAKVKLNVYEGVGHDFPDNAFKEQVKALRFVLED